VAHIRMRWFGLHALDQCHYKLAAVKVMSAGHGLTFAPLLVKISVQAYFFIGVMVASLLASTYMLDTKRQMWHEFLHPHMAWGFLPSLISIILIAVLFVDIFIASGTDTAVDDFLAGIVEPGTPCTCQVMLDPTFGFEGEETFGAMMLGKTNFGLVPGVDDLKRLAHSNHSAFTKTQGFLLACFWQCQASYNKMFDPKVQEEPKHLWQASLVPLHFRQVGGAFDDEFQDDCTTFDGCE